MPSNLKIRRATANNAIALSELICENAKAMLYKHYSSSQWEIFIKYYSPEIMVHKIKTQTVFCAELNKEIVGTIALDGNFVVGFYTKLDFLNQGIGRQLMAHIENYASAKHLKEIQLASSPEGLAFYYKHGWLKVKDFVIEHYGIGFEETLMVKNLN